MMAVVKTDTVTKAKLVYQRQDEAGEMRQTTKTISNLVANVTDETLYTGVSSLAGLMDASGVSLIRVDESTLATE